MEHYLIICAILLAAYWIGDWALFRLSRSYRGWAFRDEVLAEMDREREKKIQQRVENKEYDYAS